MGWSTWRLFIKKRFKSEAEPRKKIWPKQLINKGKDKLLFNQIRKLLFNQIHVEAMLTCCEFKLKKLTGISES